MKIPFECKLLKVYTIWTYLFIIIRHEKKILFQKSFCLGHKKNIHVGVTWGGLAVSGEGRLEHGHRVQERSSLSGAGGGTCGHDATHPLQISSYFYTAGSVPIRMESFN